MSPSQSPAGNSELRVGGSVRLHGFTEAPELNEQKGTCVRWYPQTSRWSVFLQSGDVKNVKVENLDVAKRGRKADAKRLSAAEASRTANAPSAAPGKPGKRRWRGSMAAVRKKQRLSLKLGRAHRRGAAQDGGQPLGDGGEADRPGSGSAPASTPYLEFCKGERPRILSDGIIVPKEIMRELGRRWNEQRQKAEANARLEAEAARKRRQAGTGEDDDDVEVDAEDAAVGRRREPRITEDAPPDSAAHAQVKFNREEGSFRFNFRRPNTAGDDSSEERVCLQTTTLAAGGCEEDAGRIARLCYAAMEAGTVADKDEVLRLRTELYRRCGGGTSKRQGGGSSETFRNLHGDIVVIRKQALSEMIRPAPRPWGQLEASDVDHLVAEDVKHYEEELKLVQRRSTEERIARLEQQAQRTTLPLWSSGSGASAVTDAGGASANGMAGVTDFVGLMDDAESCQDFDARFLQLFLALPASERRRATLTELARFEKVAHIADGACFSLSERKTRLKEHIWALRAAAPATSRESAFFKSWITPKDSEAATGSASSPRPKAVSQAACASPLPSADTSRTELDQKVDALEPDFDRNAESMEAGSEPKAKVRKTDPQPKAASVANLLRRLRPESLKCSSRTASPECASPTGSASASVIPIEESPSPGAAAAAASASADTTSTGPDQKVAAQEADCERSVESREGSAEPKAKARKTDPQPKVAATVANMLRDRARTKSSSRTASPEASASPLSFASKADPEPKTNAQKAALPPPKVEAEKADPEPKTNTQKAALPPPKAEAKKADHAPMTEAKADPEPKMKTRKVALAPPPKSDAQKAVCAPEAKAKALNVATMLQGGRLRKKSVSVTKSPEAA